MTVEISARRRRDIIDALRRGVVPTNGLDALAVGLGRFTRALDDDLDRVAGGGSVFKAVRGEYGAGKTFFTRWLGERAKRRGFAVAEVQISELETPLHRMETVYRRLVEQLATEQFTPSALRPVLDAWIYALEEDVLAAGTVAEDDPHGLDSAVGDLLERRLAEISRRTPGFAAALRGYRTATSRGDQPTADGLAAWLGGQPHVAATARRAAGVKGDLDHFGALSFLQGLLTVLSDSGHRGLLLVLDEVETLQRVRSDARDKALNALRQLVDDVYAGRFPGLFLMITGTPAFFDGQQGVQRLAPLAQRLATDFGSDPRWDNPRATQLRLPGFSQEALVELGMRVRDIYGSEQVARRVDDAYLGELARAVAGRLGGQVGVAPRLYLKKLVADVFDRVDQFDDWDPRRQYQPTLRADELTQVERNAAARSAAPGGTAAGGVAAAVPGSADEIELPM
ncbi:BREX system ATP-binding protein BrxD [Plantactinospora sp. GCM10030261]|uniref:BREX system ATP-binding protein BrxD n=1 Tax=Plantactinospora sp. GCM10030261 TaxID=3273420 RepID=UPI0036238ECF